MTVSQHVPVQRTADHDLAASFLSAVKGEAVGVGSPFVAQLVEMLAKARADAFAQAAVRADEDRVRLTHHQEQERIALDQAARVTAEIEYRHLRGRYGRELGAS